MTTKIQQLCTTLQANGYDVQWYNTGGGCMCVRIVLGDDSKDWSDILVGEGAAPYGGPDSLHSSQFDDDTDVSGIWFASASDSNGEPIEEPVMLEGDTADLLEAIARYVRER